VAWRRAMHMNTNPSPLGRGFASLDYQTMQALTSLSPRVFPVTLALKI